MEKQDSTVLIIKYNKASKETIEKAIESFCSLLNTKDSTVEKVYQGDDKKMISALESVLGLSK